MRISDWSSDVCSSDLVGRLRAAIDDGAIDRFDRRTAADLYTLLVPAETAAILRPARRLSVVANGTLGALPFGLLVPDVRRDDYLIDCVAIRRLVRSEEHTSELQSLMRISYAVF